MRNATATTKILEALKRGDRITGLDALRKWGTYRLAGIIYNLRRAGHPIVTDMKQHGKITYAEYYLR
jgi:hypothetical protein